MRGLLFLPLQHWDYTHVSLHLAFSLGSGDQAQVPMLAQWAFKDWTISSVPKCMDFKAQCGKLCAISTTWVLCSHIGHTYRHTYACSPFTDTVGFFDALCLHLLLQRDCSSLCLWWKCAPVCGEALHCLISKRVGDSTLGVVREKERRLASGNGINGKWSDAFKTIFSCLTLILPPHASLIILWAEENCVNMIRGSFTRGSEKVRLFSIRLWVAEVCSLEWYEILRKKEKYLWAKSTSKCQGDYPKKCKEAPQCVILGQASI